MILYPGVRSFRAARGSRLAFFWDARDATLLARTGQQGVLTATPLLGTIGGVITPAVGPATVQAGKAQPRFGRVGARNVLDLTGVDAGQDVELLTFPFAWGLCSHTLLLSLTPTWAIGASRSASYAFALGNSAVGPTVWRIHRGGAGGAATGWNVYRGIVGTSHTVTVQETGVTAPLDILATYDHATGIDTISLRGANGVVVGPTASAAMGVSAMNWIGDVLTLGGEPATSLNAPTRLHRAKLAVGVKTFADMDGIE